MAMEQAEKDEMEKWIEGKSVEEYFDLRGRGVGRPGCWGKGFKDQYTILIRTKQDDEEEEREREDREDMEEQERRKERDESDDEGWYGAYR